MYLEGGTAPGRTRAQVGARDTSLWREAGAVTLPHRLLFAGDSRGWGGGGVAFVDPQPSQARTLARAYLITVEQFQDVLAQESGRQVGSEVDLDAVLAGGSAVLGDGNYDRVLNVGTGDVPMLTFTTPRPVDALTPNAPGPAYRQTIVAGVIEAHGLDRAQADRYVADHAG